MNSYGSHLSAYYFPSGTTCEESIPQFGSDFNYIENAISPWDFCKVTDGVVCVWCVDGAGNATLAQTCEIEHPDPCVWIDFQFDAQCTCTDV